MTENCGTNLRVWNYDPSCSGTVGSPGPCSEMMLIDVPQMGYTAEDKPNPRGEICMRGGHLSQGYYKGQSVVLNDSGHRLKVIIR